MIFRPGRGMNYFMVFNFTCMYCGDLNSAHKDFLKCSKFQFIRRASHLRRGRVLFIVITITNTVV